LLCRSPDLNALTDLILDEASRADLVRMLFGCPQLKEIKISGTCELLSRVDFFLFTLSFLKSYFDMSSSAFFAICLNIHRKVVTRAIS
jgi:hypothetical protein